MDPAHQIRQTAASRIAFSSVQTCLAFAVLILVGVHAPATFASSGCEVLLSKQDYRLGQHVNLDVSTPPVLSRKPEGNSLEDRYPGIAKEIIKVAYGRMPFFRWTKLYPMTDVEAQNTFEQFLFVTDEISEIPSRFKLSRDDSSRFVEMVTLLRNALRLATKHYNPFAPMADKISGFFKYSQFQQSSLFELVISTLIDGEEFYFHRDVLKQYRGERVTTSGHVKRHSNEREIDIIIRRRDKRELWVEFKNLAMPWALEDYADWSGKLVSDLPRNLVSFQIENEKSRRWGEKTIVEQLSQQILTRRHLAKDSSVDILLISKLPLPSDLYQKIQQTGVDAWSLFYSSQAFLPQYFDSISKQIVP